MIVIKILQFVLFGCKLKNKNLIEFFGNVIVKIVGGDVTEIIPPCTQNAI